MIISLQPHLHTQRKQKTQTTNMRFYSLVPPASAGGLFWPLATIFSIAWVAEFVFPPPPD